MVSYGTLVGATCYERCHLANTPTEIFSRVAAKANESGVRVVLVNRRGYPGTAPFTEEEKVQHAALQERTPEGGKATRDFFRYRAREILEILEKFIVEEKIAKEGGVILSAWSLGTLTLNAFLTYAPTLPVGKVDVVSYIKFAIPYGKHSLRKPSASNG